MPKVGMEPLRRRALIDAAIAAIGERGSLNVTMSDIAGRAGVSAALAHHYFGAKDELMQATMRHILRELAGDAAQLLAAQATPRARLSAMISVSFSPGQFRPEIVASWLAFYVEAKRSQPMRQLFRIYARRLNSNLMHALRPLLPVEVGKQVAEGIAAMIDGLYIRCALSDDAPDAGAAIALVEDYVETALSLKGAPA